MVMQKLDSGNASIVLKGFLSFLLFGALAGLVLTDVGGFFRDGGTSAGDIARVGERTVSAPEFAQNYQRRVDQAGINPDIALQMNLPNMVLQQEIERLILLQAAQQNGSRISDSFVADQLKRQLDTLQMTGTPYEKLQQVLMQQRLSEKQLVELLRGDFSINVLASAVATGDMLVPSDLVVAAYRHEMQKRNADIIRITPRIAKAAPLDDQAIEDYFKEHKERYRLAETRHADILVLPNALFIKDTDISDEQIREFYENNQDKFMAAESVRLAQIITDSKDTAKRIFDEKPSDLSSYQGDAVQYLSADSYHKDNLPNEIADQLYKQKKSGLYAPIETSLGWHVIWVDEFIAPTARPFAAVKPVIERQLKDAFLDEHLTAITNEIDMLAGEDTPLQEIAKKYNLNTISIADIAQNNIDAKLQSTAINADNQPRIQEALFLLDVGETSPLMDTPTGDFALVKITKITPASIPPLDDIRTQVKQDAERDTQGKHLQNMAETLIGHFNHQDSSAFDKAVKEAGLTVEKTRSVTKGNVQDEYSDEIAHLLFTLTPDNALSYTYQQDAIILVRLTGIEPSHSMPSDAEQVALQDNVRSTMLQEIQQQFTQAWQEKLGLRVNQRMLQSMFNPNQE